MQPECCPPLEPERWDTKIHHFDGRRFAKDRVFCLFYVPVGFGRTMKRLMGKLEKAQASCPDWLCLADHTSKWNMDVYLATDRDLPDTEMRSLDGRFLSRVYEGPFKDTKRWCDDFAEHARREGVETDRTYMWYTTCPRCAKKRGKNYVVIFGRLKAAGGAPGGASA